MKKDLKDFITAIENETKRNDTKKLIKIMEVASGYKATLHDKIIGFGLYHYQYASGKEGKAIVTGFSPRASNIAIYIMPGFTQFSRELTALGKHKTAKVCIYINKLADIDEAVLADIVKKSVVEMAKKYHCTST